MKRKNNETQPKIKFLLTETCMQKYKEKELKQLDDLEKTVS